MAESKPAAVSYLLESDQGQRLQARRALVVALSLAIMELTREYRGGGGAALWLMTIVLSRVARESIPRVAAGHDVVTGPITRGRMMGRTA